MSSTKYSKDDWSANYLCIRVLN